MKAWGKLDKFYLIFFSVLAALAVLVVFTFRGIFSAFLTAYEIDQPDNTDIKINSDQLNEAYNFAFNKGNNGVVVPTSTPSATPSTSPTKTPNASPTVTK